MTSDGTGREGARPIGTWIDEPYFSDGTDDDVDQGCCTDRCTGACGGYGFAFELAARNLRDGTGHWARLDGSCWDGCPVCAPASDGTALNRERRVTFIGQPSAGKSELAGRCGERYDGTMEVFTAGEIPLPEFSPNDAICKCPLEVCVCRGRP